jgi:beta-galactosidase/beta-glucuronidase
MCLTVLLFHAAAWHRNDMSFNNAVYPSGPDDLAGYQAEATHQVARLGHHPSIVLWCGNNEIEDDVSMLATPEYQKITYVTITPNRGHSVSPANKF